MMNPTNGIKDTGTSIIAGRIPMLQVPKVEENRPDHLETIDSHILAFYYAGLTNLFCQACLPSAPNVSTCVVAPVLQASHADFQMLGGWLEACNPAEVQASAHSSLYQQIRGKWREQIKDLAMLSAGQSQD